MVAAHSAKDFRIALLLFILSGTQPEVKSAQQLCDRAKSINFSKILCFDALIRSAMAGVDEFHRSRGAAERPSYDKPLSEIVTTRLDPVVHAEPPRPSAGGSAAQRSFCMDCRHRRVKRRRSMTGYLR